MSQEPQGPALAEHGAVWDLAIDLLSVAGTDGYFRHVNPAFERTLGWSDVELRSRPFAEFIHPEDVERTLTELAGLQVPGTEVRGFQNRYRTADGSYRWLSWNARSDSAGDLIYSVAIDITEQREAEAARRLSDERFELAISGAPIGMALVGTDGSWLNVNPAYEALVGYTVDELTAGMTFQDITHPDDLDTDVGLVNDLLAGLIPNYQMEKRYLRKDGTVVWVLLAVSLLRDAAGEPEVFIAQAVDITPRKRQERELDRLVGELESGNEELEAFLGAAGHDIASPLAIIIGYLDHLAATEELSIVGREMMGRAQAVAQRSVELVRGLLAFARAGAADYRGRVIDTAEVVAEVLDSLAPMVEASGARITVGRLPAIEGDVAATTSLLQNLIENAIKYAEGPPTIELSSVRRGDDVLIRVDDDGPGIPAELRQRVFAPFERSADAEETPGSGLGLATCRRIAERMGGSILATSSPLGGTRIEVRLPAALASATEPPVAS